VNAGQLTCRDFVELVTDYLEGRMGPGARARFEDHLALCPGCDAYLDQMRRTLAALGSLPEERLSGDARAALLTAFRDWNAAR
jgi:anti-sigma factor RsiW